MKLDFKMVVLIVKWS